MKYVYVVYSESLDIWLLHYTLTSTEDIQFFSSKKKAKDYIKEYTKLNGFNGLVCDKVEVK